ncbi:hypothetical protein BDN70DRAFT_870814 [Pholiota conissans]|uniref:U6 snRNA phosphodiesterase n=1 Tax=Pholiota conissans TaxID=109636 RepID=A0A9P6CZ17_9AGAR|nr:hypothetical protein BDN70DRAFT_870814 [Pholiota conissans]
MKRSALTLVSYSSSDEDEEKEGPSEEGKSVQPEPLQKKRKLPPVSASLVPPGPIDNPALHQGRIRTTPHVEGQFAAHVYVSLPLGRHSMLHKLVQNILRDAKTAIPALCDIWPAEEASTRPELHISLSRPIFLRAHQREDLKRAVKNIAKAHKAFIVSFATLSELINDEKTRTFLTLEVGAGYQELRSLVGALTPSLKSIRQQEYYVNPRFHASIAWALLHKARGGASDLVRSDSICTTPFSPSEEAGLPLSHSTLEAPDLFPTIAQLPPEAINDLKKRYSAELCSPTVGSLEVESISLKIGKEVCSWSLIAR